MYGMILGTIQSSCQYLLKHKILLFITLCAWILTLLPVMFDGQYGCVNGTCGLILGTNFRDGIWFLAVSATAFKEIPFRMPVYAGAPLLGYHFLPNLIVYWLSLIGVPLIVSYFKLIPLIYMSCFTIISVKLGRTIKDSVLFVALFLFFMFFAMHLSLFTSLYHTGTIENGALINTFQATRVLESPHAALTLVMLFAALCIVYQQKKYTVKQLFFLGVLLFLSFGTKFYIAFTILFILFLNEVVMLFKTKNGSRFLINNLIFGTFSVISIIVFYNPFNPTNNGGVFIFSPFATVHHMIESKGLFYNKNLLLARYYLYEHGWSPRLWAIELYSTALFIAFYFGTRILGFIYIAKQIITKKLSSIEIILTITILVDTTLSVLLIQKGDFFNPIQFAVPAAFLMNMFAAKFLYDLVRTKNWLAYAFVAIILMVTGVANVVNLGYLNHPARYVVSYDELEALDFLKKQPEGVIFVPVEEDIDTDTAYVSALTGKQTYVNFKNVLENAGIDYWERFKKIRIIDQDIVDLDVDYIFIPLHSKQNKELLIKIKNIKRLQVVYKNPGAIVYTIKK